MVGGLWGAGESGGIFSGETGGLRMGDLGGWSRRRMDEASSTHGRSLVDAWTNLGRREG